MRITNYRIASSIVAFCLMIWALSARDHSYSPILWVIIVIIIIIEFARDFHSSASQYLESNALLKGGMEPALYRLKHFGELTIIRWGDCRILDVAVNEYPIHRRIHQKNF